MKTTKTITRPLLVAVKAGGKFTESEYGMLRNKAWRKSMDDAIITHAATDGFGNELLLFFDAYAVEQLSLFKRLRHAFRMLKTAVARNIGVQTRIVVVALE